MMRCATILAITALTCTFASGQGQLLVKKTKDFELNGRGDAPEWNTTNWITLEKRSGQANYSTRVKMLYSESGIYVLFSNQDNKITATFREDFENLWTEDVVEAFFWTDERDPVYFEYELSPLNYELPIIIPNLEGSFYGWRPWHYDGARKTRHATHVFKDHNGLTQEWTAEFFIPYALLQPLRNVPPSSGSQWRANLYRVDHDNEYSAWSWTKVKTNFHDYKNFGIIRFE
jgi:hypothetical protein